MPQAAKEGKKAPITVTRDVAPPRKAPPAEAPAFATASQAASACRSSTFSELASTLVRCGGVQATRIVAAGAAEDLHQFRVTMRRLRALWWTYRPLLDRRQYARHRALFKGLGDIAGQVRNYDVLSSLLACVAHHAPLSENIARERALALAHARTTMARREVMRDLANTSAQAVQSLRPLPKCAQSEDAFVSLRIAVARKNMKREAKSAGHAPGRSRLEQLHELRKRGKTVRYLLELFEHGNAADKRHLKQLGRLQESLGKLNDVVASEALLRSRPGLLGGRMDAAKLRKRLRSLRKRHLRAAMALIRA